jgi:copper oxidase (laccase) domain-containing protein
MSTREGGQSDGPFASMNLGTAVGDLPERVAARSTAGGSSGSAPPTPSPKRRRTRPTPA